MFSTDLGTRWGCHHILIKIRKCACQASIFPMRIGQSVPINRVWRQDPSPPRTFHFPLLHPVSLPTSMLLKQGLLSSLGCATPVLTVLASLRPYARSRAREPISSLCHTPASVDHSSAARGYKGAALRQPCRRLAHHLLAHWKNL